MTVYNNATEVWNAINNAVDVDAIIIILEDANDSSVILNADDLRNLATSQSTTLAGSNPVILYSGEINGTAAQTIATSQSGVKVINNTDAAKLGSSEVFRDAVKESLGGTNAARDNFLFSKDIGDGTPGLWHSLSENFVNNNASGDVKVIAPYGASVSVFAETELPALKNNPSVTSINGIEKADLSSSAVDQLKQVQASSAVYLADLDPSYGALVKADSNWNTLKGYMTDSDLFSKATLAKMGVIGSILAFTIAVDEAHAAYQTDGAQGAIDVFVDWGLDFAEGGAGSVIATFAIAPLALPLIAAGGVLAFAGAAITLVASVAGGIIGDNWLDFRGVLEDWGFLEKDTQDITITINGVEQTITINDIYHDGKLAYGSNFLFDLLDGTPNLISSADANKHLVGTNDNDVVQGGDGYDTLIGKKGNDTLVGGEGNDVLSGGIDTNVLDGGTGIDTADYSSIPFGSRDLVIDLQNGTANNPGFTADNVDDTLYNIENVIGSGGDDTITGNSDANELNGGSGDDVLDGGAFTDYAVYSGDFSDYTIVWNAGSGTWTITDDNAVDGDDGIDTLTDIEVAKFVDLDYLLTPPCTGPDCGGGGGGSGGGRQGSSGDAAGDASLFLNSDQYLQGDELAYDVRVSHDDVTGDLVQNHVLAVDVSGSMASNGKLDGVKAAAKSYIDGVLNEAGGENSTFTIIAFGGSATGVYSGADADAAKSAVEGLSIVGGTNMMAAFDATADYLESFHGAAINRSVFFTDGGDAGWLHYGDNSDNAANKNAYYAERDAMHLRVQEASGIKMLGTDDADINDLNAFDNTSGAQIVSDVNNDGVIDAIDYAEIFTDSGLDASNVDRIDISLNGAVVDTILPNDFNDGLHGISHNGTIDTSNMTPDNGIYELKATLVYADGTSSAIASHDLTFGLSNYITSRR